MITAKNSFALNFLATHKYWDDKNVVKFIRVQNDNSSLPSPKNTVQAQLPSVTDLIYTLFDWMSGWEKEIRILVRWRRVDVC